MNQSTELVYSGRAGGSRWNSPGGATNHLCMPDDPDYLQYGAGVQGPSYVYGVEYEPYGHSVYSQMFLPIMYPVQCVWLCHDVQCS